MCSGRYWTTGRRVVSTVGHQRNGEHAMHTQANRPISRLCVVYGRVVGENAHNIIQLDRHDVVNSSTERERQKK
jgi:hypothetical protein